jgi:hypothetical protein
MMKVLRLVHEATNVLPLDVVVTGL